MRVMLALRAAPALAVVVTALGSGCLPGGEAAGADTDEGEGEVVVAAGEARLSGTRGAVDPAWYASRKRGYLRFATEELIPGEVLNVIAHLERTRQGRGYALADAAVPANAWDAQLARMAALADGRDFDALYLLHVLLAYRDDRALAPGLVAKVERALLDFKYWYTEPTPPGKQDLSYYWSENHTVIYHVLEYLMGQAYPEAAFTSDGKTGAEHQAHARPRLERWLDLRARFGFSEWHSNVYYQKDIVALLALVELGRDPAVVTRAAGVLDLLMFDLALHTQHAAFGVTHGRSFKKDKLSSLDEDTWHLTRLLFDDTRYPYSVRFEPGATLLARSHRYQLPEVIRRVAGATESFSDRERMGLHVDEAGPVVADPPTGIDGLSFSDPDQVSVWWGAGAIATWPVLPLTFRTLDSYQLWDNPFFAGFRPFRPLAGNPARVQALSAQAHAMVNGSLLQQVNTYTWRSPDVMLSSAVDYRPGSASAQQHSWQATADARALVFTNHPFLPLARSTNWLDDPETGGYWNGEASSPRSAQHDNVAIHIYAPQYPPQNAPPFDSFRYEPYTHAYFPQDHFDEVVQRGSWTIGRLRGGYIALYSFRPASFKVYDPAVHATNGMVRPFDLVAEGGADNVWIVEVGRAARWRSFAAFVAAVSAAPVTVTPRPPVVPGVIPGGFDVRYLSPSQGELSFGWKAPFVVRGRETPTRDFPRYDNPFSQTALGSAQTVIRRGRFGVALDFAAGTRRLFE